mmetsp:Transcript_18690/g.20572  ORF Transcript_18690/g.20572 Transcript_18690/m.20572 type:complete len:90 (-) Transcript_18690:107-376(-)
MPPPVQKKRKRNNDDEDAASDEQVGFFASMNRFLSPNYWFGNNGTTLTGTVENKNDGTDNDDDDDDDDDINTSDTIEQVRHISDKITRE